MLARIHMRYVCSVDTAGLAAESGREKALTAARLAMAAIALLWRSPSSALQDMNLIYDRRLHSQKVLTFVPGRRVLAGFKLSHRPCGPWIKDGDWEKMFAEVGDRFAVVGQVLSYIIHPAHQVSTPSMTSTLEQALLWFHEACREQVPLFAVVKYAASLDALACGKKERGITQLINVRLGITNTASIQISGLTLQQAIKDIYADGRSRTMHGSNARLGHDWTGTRNIAEQLARLSLNACFDWVAKNPTCNEPLRLPK